MSQEKVDKYKKEKYNRKNIRKKSNFKKIAAYVILGIVALVFVVYIGYSIGVETGHIEKPAKAVETTAVERSKEEIESIQNYLMQQGDANVPTAETTVAAETTAE